MNGSPFRREARAFHIWREGIAVGWNCTVRELAEAVDLPYRTVWAICRERGWPVEADHRGGFSAVQAVDQEIRAF